MKYLIKCLIKFTKKKSKLRKVLEWVCDHSGGHIQSNDIGYSGGPMIDVWCKYCDHMYQMPKTEKDIPPFFKNYMKKFDQEMRGTSID